MAELKNKIKSIIQKTKIAWPFFSRSSEKTIRQDDIDKRLVYDLSTRKIPNTRQIKHLSKFLNPREFLIVKICALVILINVAYLGFVFVRDHLQYSPAVGGEYMEGVVGYPQSINPLYAVNRDIDSDLSRLIYSSLVRYDGNGRLENDLADSIIINASGTEYLVKIKNNVKWHNGSVLTADDVLFTFNLIQDPNYRSPLRASLSIATAEKVDDLTIKFNLAESYAPFSELLTFGILPRSIWENISPKAAALSDLNLKPIGSGPFKFKSLIKNTNGDLKEYFLVTNPDYYGQKPYLDSVRFKFFVDYPEAIKALNDNQISGLGYLPFSYRKDLLAQNSLHFHELAQPRLVSLFFNTEKNKALANKDIRVSLARALDKKQIINEVFAGIYQETDSPIPKNSFAYNNDVTRYGYDPEAVKVALAGKNLSLVLTIIDSGSNAAAAEKIKAYWEAAGVKVSLRVVAGEQSANIIKDRDFEVLLYGQSIGGDPDVYAFWHSSQIGAQGLNLSNYNNPTVDKLLVEGRSATKIEDRLEKYKKFQEIITADLPAIFLYSPTYTYLQDNRVGGFASTAIVEPADRFSGISGWYLKTNKRLAW